MEDAHRDRGRRVLALLHHVEVGIEGRNLVDLRERKLHLVRERGEVSRRQIAVTILDEMQMLDQKILPAGSSTEQASDFLERSWLDLAALGRAARAPSSLARSGSFSVGWEGRRTH